MSFAVPIALILLVPLCMAGLLTGSARLGWAGRLPGMWDRAVAKPLKAHLARHSSLGRAAPPVLTLLIAAVLILALARPGIEVKRPQDFATLAGRVVVMDMGSDMAEHRLFVDALFRSGPAATAIVAVAGDAYRIVPFTTDWQQIDRYLRVLRADVMPEPGRRPHLGLARAERILENADYIVRQVVLVTAKPPPEIIVEVPDSGAQRVVVALRHGEAWAPWATSWGADLLAGTDTDAIAAALDDAAKTAARTELPGARTDLSSLLLGLAAALSLLLFRRAEA